MYQATLYIGTGFNAINIPDSISTLHSAASSEITVPALDIYQARELSRFVVKANYSQIMNADYLVLTNSSNQNDKAVYSIQNITMTSYDTAVLDVTMDYINTAGGPSALTILDGICERHHVATSSDTFGKYTEYDPYLVPAEQLKIESQYPGLKGNDSDQQVTIIETTMDLYGMYLDCATPTNITALGIDYTSSDGNVVTVPQVRPTNDFATSVMKKSGTPWYLTKLPNVSYVIADANTYWSGQQSGWISDALAYVRSLGVESCIIAQYAVPYYMISDTTFQGWSGEAGGHTVVSRNVGLVQALYGTCRTADLTNLPFERQGYGTVRNKRLFYGDNCQYHIVSVASGNEASFLPEEIYDNDTYPTIEMRVDPRPDGCPYFRFDIYRGDRNATLFFTNAVKGMRWQNVPLIYTSASGALLNKYKYDAQQAVAYESANYQFQQNQVSHMQQVANTGLGITGGFIRGVTSGILGDVGGVITEGANAATAAMNQEFANTAYELAQNHIENSYNLARNRELQDLLAKNTVVAPSINFPVSESIRDYIGNECIVYRTYYSQNDVARLDKILTMYGYKHTTPLETSFFNNRSKFNYIQAAGVSIDASNCPKWLRDGVATQFASGVRIWHVKPNPAIYTNGTNT